MLVNIMAGRWGVALLLGAMFGVFAAAAYFADRRVARLARRDYMAARAHLRDAARINYEYPAAPAARSALAIAYGAVLATRLAWYEAKGRAV